MAIDGRTLTAKQPDTSAAAYNSRGIGVVAALIVWVPLAAFAVFTYWTGTFFGGTAGGIASLASTAAMIGGVYLWRRMRRG